MLYLACVLNFNCLLSTLTRAKDGTGVAVFKNVRVSDRALLEIGNIYYPQADIGHVQSMHALKNIEASEIHRNSSGDKIANVNFLRRYRTRTSKYQKENLLRLTN